MQYPKRLIEVDLPIKRISAHARREKDMRRGHIPLLHIYPAARPPAACRAVTCAALWPDPADPLCPQAFRDKAGEEMNNLAAHFSATKTGLEELTADLQDNLKGPGAAKRKTAEDDAKQRCDEWQAFHKLRRWDDLATRRALLSFIAWGAGWEQSTMPTFLEAARRLTQAAHEALGGAPGTRPLVVDPFAGGGAIPLEALRVGADAFASDLNPVAVLLNKVVLEYIPKYGQRMADEVRKWGRWVKEQAEKELAEFYPKDPDGATPIAYLWARTIKCEGPGCGAEIPLMRSLWLARKGRQVALMPSPSNDRKHVEFSIVTNPAAKTIPQGTIARGSVGCPCCGYTTPVSSVRSQLTIRHGASDDARLFAVVVDAPAGGRQFRVSTPRDLAAFARAKNRLLKICAQNDDAHNLLLTEPLPPDGTLGFRVRKYGMSCWGHLFNSRQVLALSTYARLCRHYSGRVTDRDFASAVNACLALIVDRLADLNAAMCVWQLNTPNTAHVFGRWALQMNWDYGEVNPLAGAGG
jgi:adenine-specific DNA methylase